MAPDAGVPRSAAADRYRGVAGVEAVPLPTAAEMQAWDRRAIEKGGIPERLLMENAGRAVARVVQALYPGGRVVGVFGRGHNGGDALVALRTLRAWGREVLAIPAGDAEPDPELLHGWEFPLERGDAAAALAGAGVVLDGILGTGARGAPRGPQAAMIALIGGCGRPVVALDGPSGVDMTTGRVEGAAVRATVTVAFGAPKRGLLLFPGRLHAGRILAVEIGFPPIETGEASAAVITPGWARGRLPGVPPNAHKGGQGDVAVVAGSGGVAGAATMVGMGAARAGAGKVYLLSTADNREILQVALPEALFHDRDGAGADGLLERADAVVAGPGMGTDDAAQSILARVLATGGCPLLLDADALTLLARDPRLLDGLRRPILLTPHPGEMARLLGEEVSAITVDPFGALDRAVERFGCAVLLKGAPSLVGAPGEGTLANVSGHSGIATGGMGDTLAGVAGALLAVGCAPREAGALALFFCGRAAELAGSGRALLPRDVAEQLGEGLEAPPAPGLDLPEVTLDLPPAI